MSGPDAAGGDQPTPAPSDWREQLRAEVRRAQGRVASALVQMAGHPTAMSDGSVVLRVTFVRSAGVQAVVSLFPLSQTYGAYIRPDGAEHHIYCGRFGADAEAHEHAMDAAQRWEACGGGPVLSGSEANRA